tara:strand:+ start:67 stop:888 length:822 start_codon:yes stop_codon:yes gene_type:complete
MNLRVKNNIYEGTQGVYSADGLNDQMRVRAMVIVQNPEGDTDGPQLIRDAVNKYFEEDAGRYYSPGHNGLPVSRVNGRQIARNLVELQIDYSGRPVFTSRQLATFSTITLPTPIYTKAKDEGDSGPGTFRFGLPFGAMIDGSPVSKKFTAEEVTELRTRSHPRSAIRITLDRVSVGANPMRIFGEFIRTVSSNSVDIAGFTCAPGTLLLEGLQSTATTSLAIDVPGNEAQIRYEYKMSLVYDFNSFPVQGFKQEEEEHVIDIAPEYKPANWSL